MRSTMYGQTKTVKHVRFAEIPQYSSSDDNFNPDNSNSYSRQFYCQGAMLLNMDLAPASKELIKKYLDLPRFEVGKMVPSNPLHAIFVIKVALDHSEAEKLIDIFLHLQSVYSTKKIYNIPVVFPCGSEWSNQLAFLQLLRGYILNQPHRFNKIPHGIMKSIRDECPYIMTTYASLVPQAKHEDRWAMINNILQAAPSQKKNELDASRILQRMKPRH